MSRAHMLYDDEKLQTIPVKVTTWNGSWNPDKMFQLKSKTGVIGEGQLLSKSRHLIIDSTRNNFKVHYMVFYIDVKMAYRRRYDANGEEIQPDFGSKQKVNTGFLMSSYKEKSKESEDSLMFKQLQDMIHIGELSKLTRDKEQSFCGKKVISLWFQEADFDGMEFCDGSEIRFRTKGEKSYIESISCLNADIKHLSTNTGDKQLGGSWTDKVMAMKDSSSQSSTGQQGDAAEDDEWDDD